MSPGRILSCALLSLACSFAGAADFDLLIRNGRIVDGSGNPWFIGDVAVKSDRIVAVGRKLSGSADRVVEAEGLVVAPGFVDIHSHSDWVLLEDGTAPSKIRQGVTTEILGEGRSAGPSKGRLPAQTAPAGRGEKPVTIRQLGDYFDAVEERGISVNVASYVGLGTVWECVRGRSHGSPDAAELEAMKELVAEAMAEGALGLSCQLMMPPGLLATTDELVALCEPVHDAHGIFSTHIRNEGTGVFESVRQAIEIGERAGVPVDVIHLKIADQQYWGRMAEVVTLIENARARGVDVQANVYPYTRGNNNLASIIPPWAHEGGRLRMLARLKDPAERERLKHDIEHGIAGWYNHYTAVGGDWSRMLISADNDHRGRTMDKVLAGRIAGRDPEPDLLDEFFDFLVEQNGSVGTVYAHHEEKDMNLALVQPWCSVGSDGSAYATEGPLRRGNPHPRNFGTFPRLLGKYVREEKLLPLEDAIRKITSLNAAKVGLDWRGSIQAGFFADLTLFDPDTVIDRATYTDPFHYNEGIEWVIVNGEIVLEPGGRHTGAKPGRALRRGEP